MKHARTLVLLGAFGAGLMAASTASAQTQSEVGSRFEREKFEDQRDMRQLLSGFGGCIATRKTEEVGQFLASPNDASWSRVMNFPNNESGCVNRDMQSSYLDLRGVIAEGWYLVTYDALPAGLANATHAVPPPAEAQLRIAAASPDDLQYVVIEEFADCVAASAPRETDALLRTRVTSRDETAAISALSPFFGPCAFEGHKLSFDEQSLRGNLAFSLARRAIELGGAAGKS